MVQPVFLPAAMAANAAHTVVHQGMTAADAAREFETMLLAAWMKTAREAGQLDEKQDEMTGAESYLEFAEKLLAGEMAKSNVFGFSKMITSELQPVEASAAATEAAGDTPMGGRGL